MKFNQTYRHLIESVSTPYDLLTHAINNNKTGWKDIIRDFEKQGGSLIGSGTYGDVLRHPSWPYVAKIFAYDPCYLKFIRFVINNPLPAFPKFFGYPQKVYPSFSRSIWEETMYIIRMEKLNEIPTATIDHLNDVIEHVKSVLSETDWDLFDIKLQSIPDILTRILRKKSLFDRYKEFIKENRTSLINLIYAWLKIQKFRPNECFDDSGDWNQMIRSSTGQFVITDPWAKERFTFPEKEKRFLKYDGIIIPPGKKAKM